MSRRTEPGKSDVGVLGKMEERETGGEMERLRLEKGRRTGNGYGRGDGPNERVGEK